MHKVFENLVIKYRENVLSHAFLVETNNVDLCIVDIKSLIKRIVCTDEYNDLCEKCNLCHLITNESLPSVNIVVPDGASIKKSQIIDLKSKLMTKPIYTNMNFYIIQNAEKMTISSFNTLLKFLEEPSGQVIGFYVTNNTDNIIDTIKSRCQIYKVMYNEKDMSDVLGISSLEYEELYAILKDFIYLLENNIDECMIEINVFSKALSNRIRLDLFFKLLLHIYESQFKRKCKNINEEDDFSYIILKNSIKKLSKKLCLIEKYLSKLHYNPNIDLLFDSFIIEMSEICD